MSIVAMSATRVRKSTSDAANARIAQTTAERLHHIGYRRFAIEKRLRELDQEWDVERIIEANASTLALTGIVLGLTVSKKFFVIPLAVTTFLLQHAIQGWCPPIPVLRHHGFRTVHEIERERHILLRRLATS